MSLHAILHTRDNAGKMAELTPWLLEINKAYKGNERGAIKEQLRQAKGEGKKGELPEVLAPKVQDVIDGLLSFGDYTAAEFKSALRTALNDGIGKICNTDNPTKGFSNACRTTLCVCR